MRGLCECSNVRGNGEGGLQHLLIGEREEISSKVLSDFKIT